MNDYTIRYKTYKVNGQKRTDIIVYQNGTWINKFITSDAEKNKVYAHNLVNALRKPRELLSSISLAPNQSNNK